MSAARFVVSGGVQGVWFRASTRGQAVALGLRGHAVNLDTGDVEVVAAGAPDALETLARWLQVGPPLARVERVTRESHEDAAVGDGFRCG